MKPDTHLLFEANRKSALVGYVLLFILGWLGAHRFYLGRKTSGLALIVISLTDLIALANGAVVLTVVATVVLGVWLLLDVFLIPGIVQRLNNQLAAALAAGDIKRALAPREEGSLGARIVGAASLLPESPVGIVGLAIVLFWILVALLAPLLTPLDPLELPGAETARGTVWLGTDLLGRDVLSRIIHGSRTVMIWAPLATACAYLVGVVFGLIGGYFGKWTDTGISFVANLILSFPVLVIYILFVQTFGASGATIVIAVTFASAPAIFRLVRGEVLTIRSRDFIAAAKTRGESVIYILFSEILPNAKGPLIVDACLRMGYTTIAIGVLGFLGFGFPPPTPDWGGMVNENRSMALVFPHMTVFPCLAISSFVLGLNLLSDGIREISLRQ